MQKFALAVLKRSSEQTGNKTICALKYLSEGMLLDVICAILFEKRLSSVFTRKHSRQVESACKYANHPFVCNLSRIPICMIFAGLKVVLFKRDTFVSKFLFKLFDREKVLHNCNRQNIHVAETTCTPVSAIFYSSTEMYLRIYHCHFNLFLLMFIYE